MLLATVFGNAWGLTSAGDEADRHSEEDVKAAFMYKFLSFVDWPPRLAGEAGKPFTLGVLGAEDIVTRLQQIVPGRSIQGRPIVVRNLKYGESLEGVQALYIGRLDSNRLADLASHALPLAVLTVCEADDGIEHGCVINFVIDEGRVRFDVSLDAAQSSQLALSSRMLAFAHRVTGGK